jgi:beta-mannosidase
MGMMTLDGDWQGLVDKESNLQFDELGSLSSWEALSVPANWMLTDIGDVLGTVWYRKRFQLAEDRTLAGEKWLHFDGIDYQATIWLNGQLLGEHEGYFQSFEYPITQSLVSGDNELVIKVTAAKETEGDWPNRKRQIKGLFNHWDCRPGSWDPATGQEQGSGGIWNSVWIEIGPPVSIRSVRATPHWMPDDTHARVTLETEVLNQSNQSISVQVRSTISANEDIVVTGPEVNYVVVPGLNTVQVVVTIEKPRLWWSWDLGEPFLYHANLTLDSEYGAHERSTTFGIRSLVLDSEGAWILNGQRVFIRGTNIMPTQWLSEYTPTAIATDVGLLLEAGFNAVRVCVHVNREEFYRACDKAGLLLWQDFPLQWNYSQDDEFAAEAVRQARDMIHQLYNHPSVVIWCMQNEPTAEQRPLVKLLDHTARSLDASRVVVPEAAFAQHPYPGWYHGNIHEYARIPGAPFVTEFGAQALPSPEAVRTMLGDQAWPPDWDAWGYHDFQYHQTFHVAGLSFPSSLDEFVEESQAYQARLLKVAIEHYRRAKWQPMVGFFQFMFVDCWPSITWSVVDYYRQPKLGYSILKDICQPVMVSIPGDAAAGDAVFIVDRSLTVPVHVVNDRPFPLSQCLLSMSILDEEGALLGQAEDRVQMEADASQNVSPLHCTISGDWATMKCQVNLTLKDDNGVLVTENHYTARLVRLGRKRRYAHHD